MRGCITSSTGHGQARPVLLAHRQRRRREHQENDEGLTEMNIDLHGPGLWYATRATGLVTLLLLTVSVLLGLLTAGRFARVGWPRFLSQGLHRNVSRLVLAFLALHVAATVADTYTSIPLTA